MQKMLQNKIWWTSVVWWVQIKQRPSRDLWLWNKWRLYHKDVFLEDGSKPDFTPHKFQGFFVLYILYKHCIVNGKCSILNKTIFKVGTKKIYRKQIAAFHPAQSLRMTDVQMGKSAITTCWPDWALTKLSPLNRILLPVYFRHFVGSSSMTLLLQFFPFPTEAILLSHRLLVRSSFLTVEHIFTFLQSHFVVLTNTLLGDTELFFTSFETCDLSIFAHSSLPSTTIPSR